MPGEDGRGTAGLEAAARELAAALEGHRGRTGRAYPTWSEILGLLRELGYRKPAPAVRAAEEGPPAGGRCYLVQVDADGDPERADRIASVIASLGGRDADAAPGIFVFAAESDRDAALDAVRHAFGRTAALPAAGPCRTWWPAERRRGEGAASGLRGDSACRPGGPTHTLRSRAFRRTS